MKNLFSLILLLFVTIANASVTVNDIDRKKDIVILYGMIDHDVANEVAAVIISKQKLAPPTEPIYLLIDSNGGDLMAGIIILNAMKNSIRPVYTVVMGSAMSMAGIILEHGAKRYMQEYSFLIIHDLQIQFQGSLGINYSRTIFMEKFVDGSLGYIANRSGKITAKELKEKSYNEWWIDSTEAKKYNFIDDVIVSNSFTLEPTTMVGTGGGNEAVPPPTPDNIKQFMEKLSKGKTVIIPLDNKGKDKDENEKIDK